MEAILITLLLIGLSLGLGYHLGREILRFIDKKARKNQRRR